MGVKFNREYKDIVADLAHVISDIPNCHEFFEMSADEWNELEEQERKEVVRTLADDVFYGLGKRPQLTVGSGQIEYDPNNHVIKVTPGSRVVHVIRLI